MSEQEFEIGTRKFQVKKINAFKQFHIVRRLTPILAEMLPAMKDIARIEKNAASLTESEKLDQFASFAAPIMEGLSKLTDDDANKVLYGLLSASYVKQEPAGNWAPVATETMLMMQDLELPVLLQIAGKAFMFNLSGFFAALPRQA